MKEKQTEKMEDKIITQALPMPAVMKAREPLPPLPPPPQ